jgi:hypothetical protein
MIGLVVLGTVFGIHQGIQEAKRRTGTASEAKAPALTPKEKEDARAILNELKSSQDEVTGTRFLNPAWTDGYDNQFFTYIGINRSKNPYLRLKIRYKGKEVLIIRSFVLRIDDKVETIEPSGMLKSDIVGDEHWEWFDEPATAYMDIIEAVAKADKVLLRCEGTRYNDDRTITESEKASLRAMLLVYRYLKAGAD